MDRKNHGIMLEENQFLLKTRQRENETIGFLTKLNKDGSIPVAFWDWPNLFGQIEKAKDDFTIYTEVNRRGWRVVGFRFGESQNWVKVKHPDGFILEIYANKRYLPEGGKSFMQILETDTIVNGELENSYRWEDNLLY